MIFGDPRLSDKFWSRVEVQDDGCWHWTGKLSQWGYAYIQIDGWKTSAHRMMCEVAHGEPNGLFALHSCDVRHCVNPDHLRWGTQKENLAEMTERGRARRGLKQKAVTHCPEGHLYDEENTYISKSGSRVCRACQLVKNKEWRERRKSPDYEEKWAADWEHGTPQRFRYGCRCHPCRDARNVQRRAQRKRSREKFLAEHGKQPRKKRAPKTHCKYGHELTDWNRTSQYACKACGRARASIQHGDTRDQQTLSDIKFQQLFEENQESA